MSETIPEDIREKARAIIGSLLGDLDYTTAQALISERKATIERCAKIAESHDRDDRSNWGRVIAKAIRALSKAGTE